MKLRNKLLLSSLGLCTLVASTSLIMASCTKQTQEDPLAKSYQHEYANDMSMFLDKDKKTILKITTNGQTNSQSYGAFQDLNVQSPTYKGWYLLLRDKSKDNPKEEIIASFCGWNSGYYSTQNTELSKTKTFSVPETIELPSNYSIDGLNSRTLEVRGLGFDNEDKFEGYKEIWDRTGGYDKFYEHLFFDPELKGYDMKYGVYIFLPKKLDLSLTKIRYMFKICFSGNWFTKNLINTHIIFPKSLVYMDGKALNSHEPRKATFDFSKTQLVELKYIYILDNQQIEPYPSKIILPKSCVRLGIIAISKIESINLENVLYYGDETFSDVQFPNNTVKINKNAKYKKEPNHESRFTTFPPNITIEYY